MNYKKITLYSLGLLAINLILRIVQLLFIIEPATGFYKKELAFMGGFVSVLILILAAASGAFGYFINEKPENKKSNGTALCISALMFAVITALEVILSGDDISGHAAVVPILRVFQYLSAIFFAFYGISTVIEIKLPKLLYLLPVFYMAIKVVNYFTAISPIAIISDNIFVMVGYLAFMCFILNFARECADSKKENGYKKLFFTGIFASNICFTQSLGYILLNLINPNYHSHTSLFMNMGLLFMGIFALVFCLVNFSKEKEQ